jgi:hypothetical protein
MANAIYDKYKTSLLTGTANVSLTTETVKISLINSGVENFITTDQFYSDVTVANGVISTATLANVSITDGVLDANDVRFLSVPDGSDAAEALLIWIDTADANTSHLVAWLDTNIDGLPITPDGSNVDITWSSQGIFKL